MTIENSLILLYSKNHTQGTMLDQVERWYKTKYTFAPISEELKTRVRGAHL